MYGEWLEVRDMFKDILSNSPDSVIEMIKKEKFVPCVSVGSLESWINPLKYSIYGEVGYIVWGFDGFTSGNSFYERIKEKYIEKQKSKGSKSDKWMPKLDDLIVSIIYISGVGIAGLGIVTDVDLDPLRNFKGWAEGIDKDGETSRFWLMRARMKVIWLHEDVRRALQKALNSNFNSMRELEKSKLDAKTLWETYKCGSIPGEVEFHRLFRHSQCNSDPKSDKSDVYKTLKQLIKCIVEKDEQGVRETYNFYNSLMSLNVQSTPKVETQVNVGSGNQLEPIDCGKGSIEDVMALSNKFFVNAQRKGDFFKLLASSIMIHNVLLIGPPGTGKTSMAISVVDALTGKNSECYEITTANALWFRRNLVGGESMQRGEISWTSGILIRAYNKAARVTNGNYYVIIDEINRADVDKAFGEILTLMSDVGNTSAGRKILDEIEKEIRKFGDENSDKLDEEAKQFLRNLRLLGEKRDEPLKRIRFIATMNEVDANNLFPIGEALTRRFLLFRIDYPCGDEDVKMFLNSEEFLSMRHREVVEKVVTEEVNKLRMKFGCDKESEKRKNREKINFNISPASVKLALSLLNKILEEKDNEETIRMKFLDALEASLGTVDERVLKKFNEYKSERLGNNKQSTPG